MRAHFLYQFDLLASQPALDLLLPLNGGMGIIGGLVVYESGHIVALGKARYELVPMRIDTALQVIRHTDIRVPAVLVKM